jgi:hypothetical protein
VLLVRAGTRLAVVAGPLIVGVWVVARLWHDGREVAAVVAGAVVVVALESMIGAVVAGLDRDLAGAAARRGPGRAWILAALPALGAGVALWRGAPGLATALALDAAAVAALSVAAARLGGPGTPTRRRSRDALG